MHQRLVSIVSPELVSVSPELVSSLPAFFREIWGLLNQGWAVRVDRRCPLWVERRTLTRME